MTTQCTIKMLIICIFKAASKPTQLYFKWHFRTILNKEHNIFNEHAISNRVDSVVLTHIPLQTCRTFTPPTHTHTHKMGVLIRSHPPLGKAASTKVILVSPEEKHTITSQYENAKGDLILLDTTWGHFGAHHNFRSLWRSAVAFLESVLRPNFSLCPILFSSLFLLEMLILIALQINFVRLTFVPVSASCRNQAGTPHGSKWMIHAKLALALIPSRHAQCVFFQLKYSCNLT